MSGCSCPGPSAWENRSRSLHPATLLRIVLLRNWVPRFIISYHLCVNPGMENLEMEHTIVFTYLHSHHKTCQASITSVHSRYLCICLMQRIINVFSIFTWSCIINKHETFKFHQTRLITLQPWRVTNRGLAPTRNSASHPPRWAGGVLPSIGGWLTEVCSPSETRLVTFQAMIP